MRIHVRKNKLVCINLVERKIHINTVLIQVFHI